MKRVSIAAAAVALALMPVVARAQQASVNEACSIVFPFGNMEVTYVGPGAGDQCAGMLAMNPGSYPTNRPPDGYEGAISANGLMVIVGTAFGTAHGGEATAPASSQELGTVSPIALPGCPNMTPGGVMARLLAHLEPYCP